MSSRPSARSSVVVSAFLPVGCARCGDDRCEACVKRQRREAEPTLKTPSYRKFTPRKALVDQVKAKLAPRRSVKCAADTAGDDCVIESVDALDSSDWVIESVNASLGSWAVIACLKRKMDGRELVLKAMNGNYRLGDDCDTRFASEVTFQQLAAGHGLAPKIHQYGWGSSLFFADHAIRSALRPYRVPHVPDTAMLYILMERWPSSLREWWDSAADADKDTVRSLTYKLYDRIADLGLRLDDVSADNVMVRSKPTLSVCAIDFDPNMTVENQGAHKAMRGAVEGVFEWLDLEHSSKS